MRVSLRKLPAACELRNVGRASTYAGRCLPLDERQTKFVSQIFVDAAVDVGFVGPVRPGTPRTNVKPARSGCAPNAALVSSSRKWRRPRAAVIWNLLARRKEVRQSAKSSMRLALRPIHTNSRGARRSARGRQTNYFCIVRCASFTASARCRVRCRGLVYLRSRIDRAATVFVRFRAVRRRLVVNLVAARRAIQARPQG